MNKDVEEALKIAWKSVNEYGYYVHNVHSQYGRNYSNIHTHGVKEDYNHEDFQMVIAIHEETASHLMHDLVMRVKDGEVFKDGDILNDLIKSSEREMDLRVQFKEVISDEGRKLLRVLLPDRNGKLPGERGCNPAYAKQLKIGLEESKK